MNDQSILNQASELITRDLELEETPTSSMSEEELLLLITHRVAYLIEHNMELLLSSLYRLDVSEQKINNALMPGNPTSPDSAIAMLILQRQKERIITRLSYKQPDIDGWDRF
jgi:UDP-N-acetylglucosamine 2-epimerase